MNEEELLLRFHKTYPGVYLSVTHQCRVYKNEIVHEWTFWHEGAGEHVGPCATAAALLAAVDKWERSGERAAACALQEVQEMTQRRREALAKERLRAEAAMVADPTYTPTVEEAARHPKEFVDGMRELGPSDFHSDPRD